MPWVEHGTFCIPMPCAPPLSWSFAPFVIQGEFSACSYQLSSVQALKSPLLGWTLRRRFPAIARAWRGESSLEWNIDLGWALFHLWIPPKFACISKPTKLALWTFGGPTTLLWASPRSEAALRKGHKPPGPLSLSEDLQQQHWKEQEKNGGWSRISMECMWFFIFFSSCLYFTTDSKLVASSLGGGLLAHTYPQKDRQCFMQP